ncbi:MAG: hypothetical protein HFI33_11490 [Lachnospiraceae bacterium]|nr:hypothetical protein [Lachnospiraceae bacterium]
MRDKRRLALALAVCLVAGSISGCGSRSKVTEDMIPTVTDLHSGASVTEEPEAEPAEVLGLAMNTSYLSELTRLDGDNTEAVGVEAKDVHVVMKATSVEKDLKIKFVNEKNGRVITGIAFAVEVTGGDKKAKSYTDEDKDGIIHIKEMEGGSYKVSMKSADGYQSSSDITATVKDKIEYAVVDVTDEIKKESEINVSKEDGAYGGGSTDSSTIDVPLTDTVEYVESTKTPIYAEGEKKQKTDGFGQPMYAKQKVDKFGTPMFAKVLSEPYHLDENNDNICDWCNGKMDSHVHSYTETVITAATCEAAGTKELKCSCGDKKTEEIPALGHNYVESSRTEPTTSTEGAIVKTCTNCNNSVTEKIPVLPAPPSQNPSTPENPGAGTGTPTPDTTVPSDQPTDTDTTIQITTEADQAAALRSIGLDRILAELPEAPGVFVDQVRLVGTTAPTSLPVTDKVVYDTSSAPIYDTASEPVYEEQNIVGYKYTGWQTIDGKTYFYDKNGNCVTGTQVIQGVQYTFDTGGNRSGVIGIDVSKYQSSINWQQVKNAGIDFVIIRCGYRGYGTGVLVEDPMFRSHVSGAKAAGLRVGVYFFSQAVTEAEAVEEASMAISLVKKVGGVNLPIAIDSEYAAGGAGRADGLSKSERTAITKAFCNTIANSGYTPMVYASKSWFGEHLNVSALGSYRIWVAHYAASCGYTGRYDIWQYTSKGKVSGVSGNVDMNISYM